MLFANLFAELGFVCKISPRLFTYLLHFSQIVSYLFTVNFFFPHSQCVWVSPAQSVMRISGPKILLIMMFPSSKTWLQSRYRAFESRDVNSRSLFKMKKGSLKYWLFIILNNHPCHCSNNSHWLLTGRTSCTVLCFSALCLFIQFFSWTETLTGGMTLPNMYWVRHVIRTRSQIPSASEQSHTQIPQQPCNCRRVGHLEWLTTTQEELRRKSLWRRRDEKDRLANQET